MQHIGSIWVESQILIMIRIIGIGRTVIERAGLAQRGKILWRFSQKVEEREIKQVKLGAVNKADMRTQLMANNHNNIPSSHRELATMETISNQGLNIDFAIFINQSQPAFIRDYIQQSSLAKTVRYYNPHLTNGGNAYDEFPLIKLLSIALRKIEEDDVETSNWKMLEFYIRKRLHRCTIQENLKLLYIMLKVFPKYAFDYGFIMSICLALKKEIGIMSSDELKMLFYVLHTNRNEAKRYNNSVIANIQTIILTKILEKCEKKLVSQQQSKHVHLPIEYLYSWITFGLVLSVRNNYQDLVFEQRTIELISHFNNRWQAAVLKEQQNRIINESQIATTLYMLSIFDKLIKFYEGTIQKDKNKEKVKIVLKEEFNTLKVNVIAHTSRKISKIVEKSEALHSIRTLRVLLELYSFDIVENLLQMPQTNGNTVFEQGNYSKIMHYFVNVMKYQQTNKEILTEKVKLLNNLYNKGLISYTTLKTYYLSLNLKHIESDCTLQLAHQLILLELYLFTEEEQFSPQPQTVDLILAFLENHPKTYRHFDWHVFHFITCLINKQRQSSNPTLSTNLPTNHFQQSDISLKVTKIFQRLIQEVKFYNTDKLVQQQTTTMSKKPQISKIQKFFIEIRVNEMKQLQPLFAPFNRLPHFSNIKEKIAVNSLTKEELMTAEHRLQKKLMNLSGWRVVNLDCDEFVELSLNQRLIMVAERLQEEGKQVDQLRGKLELAKGKSDDWLLK